MVSVIEHQKVARRRRGGQRGGARPGGAAGTVTSPVLDFRSDRSALRGGLRMRIGARHAGTIRRVPFPGSSAPRRATIGRSLGRRVMRIAGSALHTLTRSIPRLRVSEAVTYEPRDLPVLVAAGLFAVLVNLMLLTLDGDRIVLAGAIGRVRLPEPTELVTQSQFAPAQDDFAVIGEVASVDPEQFARLEVTSYTVQPGDTLSEIALAADLELDTLISFNQIEDVRRLQAGATFQIPNRDGLLYTVKRGDTLSTIASANGTTVNAILDANDLRSRTIQEGQVLFVPGAALNTTELRIILGELFEWPTRGTFTSGFGMRADPFTGLPRFHNGIDLANAVGTPIRAAASGRVVHIQEQIGNYGRFVIVRHPDGFQTLYAHLNGFAVRTGEYVDRGEVLGTMGNTGRSTGPHLHFSVIHNGTFVDPLRYLH